MTLNLNLHPEGEYISDYIREWKCWEPITSEVLTEIFKAAPPNAVFVDIGANIGYFSLLAAQNGISVFAVEPIPANFELLQKTVRDNNLEEQITVITVPLWDKEESITLNVANTNMGLASIRKLWDVDFSYSQVCTAYPLDKFFGPETTNTLIVKIDVEHSELRVLRGMKDTFHAVSHILIEISIHEQEIFDILREYGFLYATEVGYDREEKTVRPDTAHLKETKHKGTLEQLEKAMPDRKQIMALFYKTPNPV